MSAGARRALRQRRVVRLDRVRMRHAVLRTRRSARVWRLTTRNGLRYVGHRARRLVARDAVRRAELDSRFTIRSSDDVARELGQMKGALMKFGQLLSFIVEALPDEAQQSLASLQSAGHPSERSSTGTPCRWLPRASARCIARSAAMGETSQ